MIYYFQNGGKTHEIEIYDTIQKLPVMRFAKFNKYQMIAAEIGSDFADYNRRTAKAIAFLQKGMSNEAAIELNNRQTTVFNAYNEQSPAGKSFAVLIYRIDQVEYKTYAPDDLDRILIHLNNIGFEIETMAERLTTVKKKWKWNWLRIFQRSSKRTQTGILRIGD